MSNQEAKHINIADRAKAMFKDAFECGFWSGLINYNNYKPKGVVATPQEIIDFKESEFQSRCASLEADKIWSAFNVMTEISAIWQEPLARWQAAQLPESEPRRQLMRLTLGVIEESGELAKAILIYLADETPDSKEEVLDALADVAIYSMQIFTCLDSSYAETLDRVIQKILAREWKPRQDKRFETVLLMRMIKIGALTGQCAHNVLKRDQGIRGTSQEHLQALKDNADKLRDAIDELEIEGYM